MQFSEFCEKVERLGTTQLESALAVLWFHDEKQPDVVLSSGEISRMMHEAGLGSPHSTRLAEKLKSSGYVLSNKHGFRLKTLSRSRIREWLQPILGEVKPKVDQGLGYLPHDVWKNTRGYIERVCEQLNGCFQFDFFDPASVMVRRLVETLIIECYEHLKREGEIKGSDGHYLMLRDLVGKVNGSPGLSLGRDAKKALKDVKELGDRSAHNRRYIAVKADLEKVQSGVRVSVDEMIALADLRKKT